MKKLIKVILLVGIFTISSCGDDQTDRAGQQEQRAEKEQAAPKVITPVTSTETEMEMEMEKTITPDADVSSTIPQWAVLEQNVYYYPETKMTGELSVTSPSTIPQWAILEQNVYYYPEIETSSMTDKAVDMVKDAVQERQDELTETIKEKASEMVK